MTILLAVAFVLAPLDGESARIRSHLAGVEAELRAAGVASLGPAQRHWRARLLDELHRYWKRGRFPHNTFVDRESPVFVDRDGTRCAVAELIALSGNADLVARVAAASNTAYVAELAGDAELSRWLVEHGLTAAEAARIQPAYDPDPDFAAGNLCGVDENCASNRCIVTDGLYGYCSEPCEDGSCPRGPWNLPLECGYQHGERLCLYPRPGPGRPGWPCEDATDCLGTCLSEQSICTDYCQAAADCPEEWVCEASDDEDGTVCTPPAERGRSCAVASASPAPSLAILALAWLIGRRRRRPARPVLARFRGRRPGRGR